jgi:branched-chain amino acid aminotransferase
MTIARDLGYEMIEQNLTRFDLYTADEAFFTGTAAEVTPIYEADDRPLASQGRGPITKELQQTFFDAVHGKLDKYRGWLTYLES